MKKVYGMPYMGSKSSIAEEIIDILPQAECFVDLFGGGGAISECAILSGKYKKVIYNEINPLIYKAFNMALNDEFKDETRWISRTDFDELKDKDPYVALCFSFGNNPIKGYCYAREIEEFKHSLHNFIFFGDIEFINKMFNNTLDNNVLNKILYTKNIYKRYRFLINYLSKLNINKNFILQSYQILIRLNNVSRLQNYERLHRLCNLSYIKNIELYNKSYENVNIPQNAIVYCDIPYKQTSKYINLNVFNYEKFYNWCLNNKNIVFISEYDMPNDFYEVRSFKKTQILDASHKSKATYKEKLYCNRPFKSNYDFLNDYF